MVLHCQHHMPVEDSIIFNFLLRFRFSSRIWTKTSQINIYFWVVQKKSPPALRLGDLSVVPFSRPPASRRACPGWLALMAWSASKLQVNGPKNAQMGLDLWMFQKFQINVVVCFPKQLGMSNCMFLLIDFMTSAFARIYTSSVTF